MLHFNITTGDQSNAWDAWQYREYKWLFMRGSVPLGYHCMKELGGGGTEKTYLSQRWEASSLCANQCSGTQTAEPVAILMACSIFM